MYSEGSATEGVKTLSLKSKASAHSHIFQAKSNTSSLAFCPRVFVYYDRHAISSAYLLLLMMPVIAAIADRKKM